MPYYAIDDFAAGMDVRKSSLTAPAGTLRMLKNAHVTPGGEISKRQAFIHKYTAPAGTVGMAAISGLLYAFVQGGTNSEPSATDIGVRGLTGVEGGVVLQELVDWDVYGDKFYVIVRGSTGIYKHFYNGVYLPAAKGTACRTYKSKMYTVDGSYLRFSAVGDPTEWAEATKGAGFINLSVEDSEMSKLVGLEVYYDKLAIFSDRACQIWFTDPDPNKNQIEQTLRQAGTYAPRSVRQYGSGDVLYLASDGIRSLKARAQSITASVSDIGSPLDPYVMSLNRSGHNDDLSKAISLLEPLSGRYWVILKHSILVLSNYPSPNISAWCVYEPGFDIVDAAPCGDSIYVRSSDNKVYRYGNGNDVAIYDSCAVEVTLPYLSFKKPATFKQFGAIDCSATGQWELYAAINPGDENAEDLLGTVTGPTFLTGRFSFEGHSTHVSVRMRSAVPGGATFSNLMIHYQENETT